MRTHLFRFTLLSLMCLLSASVADSQSTRGAPGGIPLNVSTSQLERLFDEIIRKTEQREAFSEIKERNMSFSALEDMKKLRSEFIASKTEAELYYALVKLSNARRDRHLQVYIRTKDHGSGLNIPEPPDGHAPIHVLPDLSDIHNPAFFVAAVGSGLTSPKPGDVIVGVNGRSIEEYIREFTFWVRHSTLHGLYWRMAYDLPRRVSGVPLNLYSDRLDLTLERPSGERYDVSLPYCNGCGVWGLDLDPRGFINVMQRGSFNVLLNRSQEIVLLLWRDFEYELIQDIIDLVEYAEQEQLLNYDMIIDVTYSSGGSRGAYAIQRLVDKPFRTTFGNVRLSDVGRERIGWYRDWESNPNAPDIFGLNESRSWLIDWARTDATEAIRRGDEYTPPVPFKLAHLPKDSDGILQPAPVHFRGRVAVINGGVWGGSHLDQFVAMFADNDLAVIVGMPTGGFSNTWEHEEILYMPGTKRPLVEFMWSIGHTIRPNGEVLEGNPAQPDIYIPLTRHNFREYYQILLDTAIDAVKQAVPHSLAKVAGDDQQGSVGTALAAPFVISVLDEDGDAIAGAVVTFLVTAGEGTLSATTVTTDANGRARSTLTLGSEPGTNTVSATVAGLESETFTATAIEQTPHSLTKVSGDGQEGLAGLALAAPFVVSVLDEGDEAIAGVAVTFSVTAGEGILSATTATTDANGQATTTLTLILGSDAETNTVEVIVAGLESVTFTATAVGQAIPNSLAKVSGDGQEGTVGAVLAEPFVVSVLDEDGAAIAGAVVTFSITAGGGTLSATTATTDANGRAATRLTLGSDAGINTVSATVEGIESVTFTATGQEDPLVSIFDTFGGGGKRVALPDSTQLLQNAPNPFNSETVLSYFLLEPGLVHLEVFALSGQRVAVLHQGPQQAGYHRLHWDGRDDAGRPVASGIYLYRLVADEAVLTRKLTLLR